MSQIGGDLSDVTGKVIVAIDKDKGSQYALKWAVENILSRGETVVLLHVNLRSDSIPRGGSGQASISDGRNEELCRAAFKVLNIGSQPKEIFLPFRCFCSRKNIKPEEIVLESNEIPKSIIEFANFIKAECIVVGASHRSSLMRFRGPDTPALISKGASDFTSVYIISKGKVQSMRNASRHQSPVSTPSRTQSPVSSTPCSPRRSSVRSSNTGRSSDADVIRSPFGRGGAANSWSYGDIPLPPPESDISFVSSGRPSIDRSNCVNGRLLAGAGFDGLDFGLSPRLSSASETSSDRISLGGNSAYAGFKFLDMTASDSLSDSITSGSGMSSSTLEDVEAQMWRLRQELKQTMEMYNAACKEAVSAKKKAMEMEALKIEERRRLEEALIAEETAMTIIEKEKQKSKAAQEAAAEAAQKLAVIESQKQIISAREQTLTSTILNTDIRYRRYTIDEIELATNNFSEKLMIGSGGYGPVYKSTLDHTQVAIKVLRPDATQGQLQFQREVEILSSIRHPNMVILLGACPEFGCLVYEYMSNGSLEDRLFRHNNTPPLPWQIRFRIAAEISTSLHFLHQTKPEPLVHRDLKPANILLDRNFVSKISDVGLARLVPPQVADSVTQCRMTQAAGTFCYIDPEYQMTGMLGIKSDVYSLGVLFLQMITGKLPMGLMRQVEMAVEDGELERVLDPCVVDWPVEETLEFAVMALKCVELRRKDRPDLGKDVLPLLQRLRDLAEESMMSRVFIQPTAGKFLGHQPEEVQTDDHHEQRSGHSSNQTSSTSVS